MLWQKRFEKEEYTYLVLRAAVCGGDPFVACGTERKASTRLWELRWEM